ncbi:MAG: glycosyltransferase [Anaerolineae bacterium]
MNSPNQTPRSILMLSLHGYVSAEPELGKPDTGGQVVYVLELAKRFSRLGYQVDLVTRQFEDQPEYDEVNEGFRVWRIPFGGQDFIRKEDMHDHLSDFVTNALSSIRNRGRQYGFVYSHYWDAGWGGQKIAEELGIPHIHTPHSLGWWKKHNMGEEMSEEDMEREYRFEERIRTEFLIYRTCDHIIATTQHQTEIIQEHYDVLDRHTTVVPPGMDENRFSPVRQEEVDDLRSRYELGEFDVLALGRMAENKGYDLLIKALPTLFELKPEARLIAGIGGEDNEQDSGGVSSLKELAAELDVNDKIVWKGYIPDDDLANYYRAASVFSLSSRYEPFGMVAIEAMACGAPAIITVHGGLADLIDYGTQALFADPYRPIEFGTMLATPMLYPKLADELAIEGSRFARRTFGWTGIAKRILGIFDRVRAAKYDQEARM